MTNRLAILGALLLPAAVGAATGAPTLASQPPCTAYTCITTPPDEEYPPSTSDPTTTTTIPGTPSSSSTSSAPTTTTTPSTAGTSTTTSLPTSTTPATSSPSTTTATVPPPAPSTPAVPSTIGLGECDGPTCPRLPVTGPGAAAMLAPWALLITAIGGIAAIVGTRRRPA